MDKENVLYTHDGMQFSYQQKSEILSFMEKRMELEATGLSEVSQLQTDTVCSSLY